MQGLHLTADLHGCRCDPALLVDEATLAALCGRAVADAGLTLVAERFFTFPRWEGQPGGVTGAVLLAESHLAVHTWPERGGVTLDVYVCNFPTDNSRKAEALLDDLLVAFDPADRDTNRILRGGMDPTERRGELLLEWLNDASAYGFRANRRLETIRSPWQTIEVFDTPQFGKLFRLDGAYMTSERDEFHYHENLVHVAAMAHPAPASALVVGGGDGGSSEELLKHPSMRRVVMAELDEEVVRVSRRHLSAVHRGALDDPRLEIRIGDGFALVERTEERFDLVVLDLTDPDTPARRLYTREFFGMCRRALAPGGALTLHIGSPVHSPERVRRLLDDLRAVFGTVRPWFLYVPLYGALWGMACASDALDPLEPDEDTLARRLAERALPDLRHWNPQSHRAQFALPTWLRELVGPAESPVAGPGGRSPAP
jgi:spermidine synthase